MHHVSLSADKRGAHLRLRPLAIACVASLACLASSHPALAQGASSSVFAAQQRFAVPAQPLGAALNALARQARVAISVNAALVAGKNAPAVEGSMTLRQALDRALSGSGLVASEEGGSVIVRAAPVASASEEVALAEVRVTASADASAAGLVSPYAGGQVARGGRIGILGNKDSMETPFNVTSYTNELIQDQQARSVGDVLLNDPAVRAARGFGNFQESYFIRGFLLNSDHVAYNGLYSLLPRQYISAELFERVEVLRGASAFLTGATPGGDGIGGTINLLPKRAPNEPLTRLTVGGASGEQAYLAADVARRFGPDDSTGVRLVAAHREGGTGIEDERVELGVVLMGLDWRSDRARISADVGYQDHRLNKTRTNVTLGARVSVVPSAPHSDSNWAQPWSYSNERDTFGTLRGEYDLSQDVTGWLAAGARRSEEANSLANITVTNASTGAATTYRFDNTREDSVNTAELGLRGKLRTGAVGHEWVVSGSYFELEKKNAYVMDFFNTRATNLYSPVDWARPAISARAFRGNDLDSPALTGRTQLASVAVGDTLSLFDDRLLLTLGARRQALYAANYAYNTGERSSRYDKSRTSPLVGATYKLRPELSLYGNYIEALSQGDTAPGTANNRGEMLTPYVSKQKEVGVKYDGGRIGGVLAAFSTEKPRAFVNAANEFKAEGEDRHRGVELTAYGEPLRGFKVLGGITFLDAEQADTGNAATAGKRVIGVPQRQANLGVEWSVSGVAGLSLDARVVATGSVYANATNTLRVPGWSRLDVGARYLAEIGGRLVTLRARVDNVSDRDYWASAGGFPNNGYLVLGTPRTVTFSAAIDL